jgi:gamma-glutamyltranspeptidase
MNAPTFDSRRSPVYGTGGMVAASQPLAAAAGLEILSKGGKAADAAVAVAATLNVTEPTSTGIGGDMFALLGRGQIILRNPENGVLTGGSDPRADGGAMWLA